MRLKIKEIKDCCYLEDQNCQERTFQNLIVILITLEVEGKYKAGKKNVKCLPMDYYRALKENLMGNFTQNRIN